MRSRGVLILFFLVAATAAAPGETSSESPKRSRLDLSAEGTGLDYPKQFGTLRYPVYPPHHGPVYSHGHQHWSPYHPINHPHNDHSRIDPYVAYLFARYARFLPQGLGLYGIYGSTGLPHSKPPGTFAFPHREK